MVSLTLKTEQVINGHLRWSLFLVIFAATIPTGIFREGFSSLYPFIRDEFNLTRAQIGLYSMFLYLSSTFASILTGREIDYRGSKWGMIFGLVTMGTFILVHALAPNYLFLLLIATITGFGMSTIVPSCNKGIVELSPVKKRSFFMGVNSAGFSIGGVIAASLLPMIANKIGWRNATLLPGFIAFLVAFFVYKKYHYKKNIDVSQKGGVTKKPLLLQEFKYFFNLKNSHLICLSGIVFGSTASIITSHFVLFLYLDHQISIAVAGFIFGIVQLGSGLGRPIWALICEYLFQGNKGRAFLCLGLMFFLITLFFFLKVHFFLPLMYALAFFMGFSGRGWHGLYYSSITDTVGVERTGIALGINMVFFRLGLMIGPPIFGYIADLRNSYDLSWLFIGFIMLSITSMLYVHMGKEL